MKTKLAGHTLLQDAIARTIDEARQKMKLAAEEKDEKEKVKKLVDYEKKEHGKVPTPKEESEECKGKAASIIDPQDSDDVEKLAAALEELDKLADYKTIGGESPQGGETLPVQSPVGGLQKYKKDGSKRHNIPMSIGSDGKPPDNPKAGELIPTDLKNRIGGTYPAKGVLKTGGVAALKAEVTKLAETETTRERARRWGRTGAAVGGGLAAAGHLSQGLPWGVGGAAVGTGVNAGIGYGLGRLAHRVGHGPSSETKKVKKSAVSYILQKISTVENGGESHQGGEQLSNTAPLTMQPGRSLIQNAQTIKNVTKREAKAPRKKELAEVLTEPAFSAAHDSKVNENLRNAAKGGVKIAAARALLAKIAEEGCTCNDAGTCRFCTMKKKVSSIRKETGGEKAAPPAA